MISMYIEFRIDSAGINLRVFAQKGTAVPMEKELRGTSLSLKNEFDKIVNTGMVHHASLVYGDYVRPFEIVTKLNG